jgi:hypothetical protein
MLEILSPRIWPIQERNRGGGCEEVETKCPYAQDAWVGPKYIIDNFYNE